MSTEIVPAPANQIVPKEDGNVAVTALFPQDMQHCQNALIQWCEQKVATLSTDYEELAAAVEHAKKQKWKTATLARHAGIADKRMTFYGKMLAALRAGFVIIPNFPVTMFAIRTDKTRPLALVTTNQWSQHQQNSNSLPVGEGVYQNPFPQVFQKKVAAATDPNKTTTEYSAEEWQELDFPVNMAKPEIMEATTHAMALQIFDQFGILPSPNRKVDPIIVGQLVLKLSTYQKREVTFMVAWHLDTRSL